MSKEQLKIHDRKKLLSLNKGLLKNQVDLWYATNKYAIRSKYDEYKEKEYYLLSTLYKDCNEDVKLFIDKKLKGELNESVKKREIVDLDTARDCCSHADNFYACNNLIDRWDIVEW